jgi:ABC-type nitrate/sulfonate/bicarbonate transport system substrate-binding protein
VAKFAAAIRDTADWANKNPDKSAVILSKYTNATVAMIQSAPRSRFVDKVTPAIVQPTIDLLLRYKQIPTAFKPEEIIYQAPR